MEKGCGWKLSCAEKPLAGMAHGNSGFLMLYTALYQITGNREYLKKINLLCEYENSPVSYTHLDVYKRQENGSRQKSIQ